MAKFTTLVVDVEGKPAQFICKGEWSWELSETPYFISKDDIMQILIMLTNTRFSTMIGSDYAYDCVDPAISRIIPNDEITFVKEVEVDFDTNDMTAVNVWTFHVKHGDRATKPKLKVMKDHVCLVDVEG